MEHIHKLQRKWSVVNTVPGLTCTSYTRLCRRNALAYSSRSSVKIRNIPICIYSSVLGKNNNAWQDREGETEK